MFTGIITDIGKIKGIIRADFGIRLEIACAGIGNTLKPGESVAVDGVCLSVIDKNGSLFFDAIDNTLRKTNLKRLKVGDTVNLESALRVGDTLSGHMVTGHIDGERRIRRNRRTSGKWILEIGILPGDEKYLVPKCSVAVNGVSLTVGDLSREFFRIFLIPHTLDNTTLGTKRVGDYVNVEFDMMAKYVENMCHPGSVLKPGRRRRTEIRSEDLITRDILAGKGFI